MHGKMNGYVGRVLIIALALIMAMTGFTQSLYAIDGFIFADNYGTSVTFYDREVVSYDGSWMEATYSHTEISLA